MGILNINWLPFYLVFGSFLIGFLTDFIFENNSKW